MATARKKPGRSPRKKRKPARKKSVTTKFVARKGARLSNRDAAIVGEELERLNQQHHGLTPEMVVAEARRKRSKLRRYFDWADDVAADKWRLHQARVLIKSVRVVLETDGEDEPKEISAFIHIERGDEIDDGEEERVYLSAVEVMTDARYRRQVLERALRELESWQRRYDEYEEFASLFSEIDRAKKRIKKAA